jgi:glutamine amidotransferase
MIIGVVHHPSDDAAPICGMIRRHGAECVVSRDPVVLSETDGLILGGTGLPAAAMVELETFRCSEWLMTFSRPILGINMGLHLLVQQGTFGEAHLGMLPGRCASLSDCSCASPNMGWHPIETLVEHPLLDGITREHLFYFIHESFVGLTPCSMASSTCGTVFSAALAKDHIFGVQFALEKSGRAGSLVLQNFLGIVSAHRGADEAPNRHGTGGMDRFGGR